MWTRISIKQSQLTLLFFHDRGYKTHFNRLGETYAFTNVWIKFNCRVHVFMLVKFTTGSHDEIDYYENGTIRNLEILKPLAPCHAGVLMYVYLEISNGLADDCTSQRYHHTLRNSVNAYAMINTSMHFI